MTCTTHHDACDCREASRAQELERLGTERDRWWQLAENRAARLAQVRDERDEALRLLCEASEVLEINDVNGVVTEKLERRIEALLARVEEADRG